MLPLIILELADLLKVDTQANRITAWTLTYNNEDGAFGMLLLLSQNTIKPKTTCFYKKRKGIPVIWGVRSISTKHY